MKSSSHQTHTQSSMAAAAQSAGQSVVNIESLSAAVQAMESNNLHLVVKGVNFILHKSFEANQDSNINLVIQLEQNPRLFSALSDLLDLLNPAAALLEHCADSDSETNYHQLVHEESEGKEWDMRLPGEKDVEFKFMTKFVDENPLYLTTLAVLRNLSFEMINETPLASNVTVLKHIVCILAGAAIHAVPMEAAQLALDIAVNIAHRMDFSGRRRSAQGSTCLEDVSASAETIRFSLSKHMNAAGNILYMQLLRRLVVVLCHLIDEDNYTNRFFLHRSLELFSKLCTVHERDPFFRVCYAPEAVERLSKFLAVSHTRLERVIVPDGLAAVGDPLGRSRPLLATLPPSVQQIVLSNTTLPPQPAPGQPQNRVAENVYMQLLPPTYLTADLVDFELRDFALDCLLVLCRYSVANAQHLAHLPRIADLLLRIARMPSGPGMVGTTTSVLQTMYRSDGNAKATQLLGAMMGPLETDANLNLLWSMRSSLIFQSTCDEHFADVVLNRVHPSLVSGAKASSADLDTSEPMNVV